MYYKFHELFETYFKIITARKIMRILQGDLILALRRRHLELQKSLLREG